jgi:hypothetical protein
VFGSGLAIVPFLRGGVVQGFHWITERQFLVRRNPWAVPLVKAHGFELSRCLTRMVRGRNRFPGRPELLCAILGPEFG